VERRQACLRVQLGHAARTDDLALAANLKQPGSSAGRVSGRLCGVRVLSGARACMPKTPWLMPSMKGPPGEPALVPRSKPYGTPPVTPMPTRLVEMVSCGARGCQRQLPSAAHARLATRTLRSLQS
jgi:hypothetical protein